MDKKYHRDFFAIFFSSILGGLISLYISRKYSGVIDFSQIGFLILFDIGKTSLEIMLQIALFFVVIYYGGKFLINAIIILGRIIFIPLEVIFDKIKYYILSHDNYIRLKLKNNELDEESESKFYREKYKPKEKEFSFFIVLIVLLIHLFSQLVYPPIYNMNFYFWSYSIVILYACLYLVIIWEKPLF